MGVRSILASMSSSWTVLDHQYDRQTKWDVPLDGWVKLNCDAAVTNLGANAAAGGVVRNADGNFLLGFAMDIGEATVTMAELKAILTSLNVLRGKGYSKIVINSDSLTAVCSVQGVVPTCILATRWLRGFGELCVGSMSAPLATLSTRRTKLLILLPNSA